ncbi:hypothetical protein AB0M02_42285 [Actinoplanes sp. NPDC051861]|uniref:hypothetical protein n=1 Tax=Actinoplanes sp. NPDC051861 TaxID=3155170 RepID=UPI003448DB27
MNRSWVARAAGVLALVSALLGGAVLSATADAAIPPPSTMPVDPATCTEVPITGFGQGAGELGAGRCRWFTVTESTSYLVRASDAGNATLASAVFAGPRTLACATVWCNLGQGTYYLVATEPIDEISATVTRLNGPGCTAVDAQGFSTPIRGTFTSLGEVHCLALPEATGRYQVMPPPTGPAPLVRLVQETGTVFCDVTSVYGCAPDMPPGPVRLIVVVQDPRTTGDYLLALQRTTGENACARMTSPSTVDLTATDFVSCLDVPGVAGGSQEILTLNRIEGDGTAWLTVYDRSGNLVCQDATPAAYQLLGCRLGDVAHMVVVRSATGAGKYRISQAAGISGSCREPVSSAFGGPATPGEILPGEVHCYRVKPFTWFDLPGTEATVGYALPGGSLYTCPSLPCLMPVSEVLVTAAEPVAYRADTWAVGSDFANPVDCERITDSVAYGFGPVTGTLNADDRAHCVSFPVGYQNEFRLSVTDGITPYVINKDWSIAPCSDSGGDWSCTPGHGQGSYIVLAFVGDGSPTSFEVVADCATLLCGGVNFALLGGNEPMKLITGTKQVIEIAGVGLHERDTLWLSRNGENVTPIVVRSVTAKRDRYTAEVDLTGVEPDNYDITATSFAKPNEAGRWSYLLQVVAPQLAIATKPSIVGTVAVSATVRVNRGVWSPAPDYFEYQWTADGSPIYAAKNASYTIPPSLRGKRLAVTVTGVRQNHRSNTAATTATTVGYGATPRATKAPRILGTIKAGKTVRPSVGAWSPTPSAFRYEWRVSGKLVATSRSLKLKKAWAGKKLTLVVIAKRTGHLDGRATTKAVKVKK